MAVTLHANTMSAVLSGNRGAVGVGIADITFNDDYTMTITLTDGSTYTSGNLRGAQGIPGIDAEYDGEDLVITTGDHTETDGGEVSTIRVKGEARTIRDRVTEEMACGAYPTETVTGDIVHFTDGADGIPVKNLSITLTPTQSDTGDPSPSNIRPISGVDSVNVTRCGKNLLAVSAWTIKTRISTADGSVSSVNDEGFYSTDYVPVHGGTDYTGNWRYYSSSSFGMAFYDSGKQFISSQKQGTSDATIKRFTFTAPANCCYVRLTVYLPDGYTLDALQVEKGTSVTAFEPFVASDEFPVSLPQTVYSGVVDVTGGTVTVTHAEIVLDGTEGWGYQDGMFYTGGKHASVSYPDGYCDTYKVVKSYAAMQSGDFVISSTATVVRVKDSGYTDAASFQANITQHPVKFIWRLATPQTITIDPVTISTLLGNNTVYADAGQVSVAYRADVGLYIDKRIAEVQALVLES